MVTKFMLTEEIGFANSKMSQWRGNPAYDNSICILDELSLLEEF